MRGGLPDPVGAKKLRGNPGHQKLNEGEPDPPAACPPCPAILTGEARAEWERMSAILLELGLLTLADGAGLTLYCQAWGRWVEAEREVDRLGGVVLSREVVRGKGEDSWVEKVYTINPAVVVAERAAKQMHRVLTDYGMTPAARSRVKSGKASARSGLGMFLAGEGSEDAEAS